MSEVTAVPIRPIAKGCLVKLWLGLLLLCLAAAALAWVGHAGAAGAVRCRPARGSRRAGRGARARDDRRRRRALALQAPRQQLDGAGPPGQRGDAASRSVTSYQRKCIPGFADALHHARGRPLPLWLPPGTRSAAPAAGRAVHDARHPRLRARHLREAGPGMAAGAQMQMLQQMMQQMQQQGGAPESGGACSSLNGAAGLTPERELPPASTLVPAAAPTQAAARRPEAASVDSEKAVARSARRRAASL